MKKLLNLDNTSGKLPCFFKIIILLVMLMSMADANAQSGFEEEIVKGIKYRFDSSNKTASVIPFKNSDNKIYKGKVVIPETINYKNKKYTVKSIAPLAFCFCEKLTSVSIPNSVTDIGGAFRGCTGLTSINIPNSVTDIGGAFAGCTGLTSINIPNSVTKIWETFTGCTGLTSINIPNSVTDISAAFVCCTGLTSINIPNSVTRISRAFIGCAGLTSITIPNSVTDIEGAFEDCTGLTSITIPNSVTRIGFNTFAGCTGLTSITIPNSVTSIGDGAFRNCSNLTSVTIPNSVTIITKSAFAGCNNNMAINWVDETGTLTGKTTQYQFTEQLKRKAQEEERIRMAKAQEEERIRMAKAQEEERIRKAQAQEEERKQKIQIVDNYIKEFKDILRSGKTPELSQDIYGQRGLRYDFAYQNKETAAKRKTIEALLTEGFREASLALDFMDVLDGLHLATSKDIESTKKQMNNFFEAFDKSNYWDVLRKAERAAGELKKSFPELGKELDKAKMTISNWNNTMIGLREEAYIEWKKWKTSFNNRLSKWTNDALREAERSASSSSSSSRSSSSSSSSSSRSSSSDDVEKVSIPSYKFTTNWRKETITGSNTAENKSGENQVREIKFEDGTEGKIKRVIGSNGYWAAGEKRYRTLDDAIAAEYTYQKYGKRREKGRW